MKESELQSKIIKHYEAKGFLVIKMIQTNKNGIPDLLLLKEGVHPFFIEVKTEKGKLSDLQKYRINQLEKYGCKTEILNTI
jgi:Holliday junction resolvase